LKAVFLDQHGGPDVLKYGDISEANVGSHEVKIEVRACALNRLDLYSRAGARGMKRVFIGPHVLGSDLAGDVVEIGSEVDNVTIGMRVLVNPLVTCMQCSHCMEGSVELCATSGMVGSTINGGYAEYAVVPAANIVPLPETISYSEGASLPTVFMPSWNIIIRRSNLQPWETILVPSASSGVGSAAIQLAKKVVGAKVIATTSSSLKADKASDLGADFVINYKEEDMAVRIDEITKGTGVDVVIDHVGSDIWDVTNKSLSKGCRYGICGVTSGYRAELQMGYLFTKQVTIFGVFMGRRRDLEQVLEHVKRGTINGVIHAEYPMSEARKAHEDMERLNYFGKLILVPDRFV